MTVDILTLSAIALGITAILSQVGLATRYKALCSLVVAVGFSMILNHTYSDANVIINGIIAGLTASGLWSGTKNTIQG